jgi:hypothetical protein|tara:strand:- start:3637 stop:3861 length:225 start_codon:yes stop_codon:yes gene_type:complete
MVKITVRCRSKHEALKVSQVDVEGEIQLIEEAVIEHPNLGGSEFSGGPRRIASEWSLIAPAEAFQWGHRPPGQS